MEGTERAFYEASAGWNTTRRAWRRAAKARAEAGSRLIEAAVPLRQRPAYREAYAKALDASRGTGTPDREANWAEVEAYEAAWLEDPAVKAADEVFRVAVAAEETANEAMWDAKRALDRARYHRNKARRQAEEVIS